MINIYLWQLEQVTQGRITVFRESSLTSLLRMTASFWDCTAELISVYFTRALKTLMARRTVFVVVVPGVV